MIEFLIERPFARLGYDVVAYRRAGKYVHAATIKNGRLEWVEVDETEPLPTLLADVDRDFLEGLVRAMSGAIPSSDATNAHLADAITVRDRLLTLVEGQVVPS